MEPPTPGLQDKSLSSTPKRLVCLFKAGGKLLMYAHET